MGDLSTSQEQNIIDNIVSGGIYVALHTDDEGSQPDGSYEVSAGDYSRYYIPEGNLTISTVNQNNQFKNSNEEIFVEKTVNDWGRITHFSFWDSESGGSPYTETVRFPTGVYVIVGKQLYVKPGNLEVKL